MKGKLIRSMIGALAVLVAGCTSQSSKYDPVAYRKAIHSKVQRFDKIVKKDIEPDFRLANVEYPPRKMALLIFKNERAMEIWAQSSTQKWAMIRHLPILGASGGPGPKLREGDRQVPEGIYHISALNPFSKYDVSLRIDYPNDFDLQNAYKDGRRQLGGDIYIHGGRFSIGCVAVGNRFAEELFAMVYHVGLDNVKVVIAPNDLRHAPPVFGDVQPSWLAVLNNHLKTELQAFGENKKGRA